MEHALGFLSLAVRWSATALPVDYGSSQENVGRKVQAQIEESDAVHLHHGRVPRFNLTKTSPPPKLGEMVLFGFEKLNLPQPKKLTEVPGQYSTAVEVLEELAKSYETAAVRFFFWITGSSPKFKSTYVGRDSEMMDPKTLRAAYVLQPDRCRQNGAGYPSSSSELAELPACGSETCGRKFAGGIRLPEGRVGGFVSGGPYSQVEIGVSLRIFPAIPG
jgi:hypothetical protein